MNINIIVTCFDTEETLPGLLTLLENFKKIVPAALIVYTGDRDDIQCNIRFAGTKPHSREFIMFNEGLKAFRKINKNTKFLKLSSHVWPLDEDKIIDIFKRMEETKSCVASNWWHHNLEGSLACDFFAIDLAYANGAFDNVTQIMNDSEVTLYQLVKQKNKKIYIIPEREPVLWNNIFDCKGLKLAMRKELSRNEELVKDLGY